MRHKLLLILFIPSSAVRAPQRIPKDVAYGTHATSDARAHLLRRGQL